ncbi:MAG: hypothetical protein NC191_00520 [Muribaculaceae bacterium]|nr:hypothetical protein [Muribaculaceae bacterium]
MKSRETRKNKAFGILELLIVLTIGIILYFGLFHHNSGRKNPFDDNTQIKTQQQAIDSKLEEIEQTKLLKENIEKNLQEGY